MWLLLDMLRHTMTVQHVTETSHAHIIRNIIVYIKITNYDKLIWQCCIYVQNICKLVEKVSNRWSVLPSWWWSIDNVQNDAFPWDVNFKLMASKELISLNVFTAVALIESLCSIPMPPPRRLDLGWSISLARWCKSSDHRKVNVFVRKPGFTMSKLCSWMWSKMSVVLLQTDLAFIRHNKTCVVGQVWGLQESFIGIKSSRFV